MKRFKKRMKPDGQEIGPGWNVGGTLHKATIGDWHQSTWANGLATCSDWVVAIKQLDGQATPSGGTFRINLDISDGKQLLGASVALLQAVTIGTEKHIDAASTQPMHGIAMAAAAALGWLHVEGPEWL